MEDQPADSGDLTTDAAEAAEKDTDPTDEAPAPIGAPRRRRRFLWRRSHQVEPEPTGGLDESAAGATEPVAPADAQPVRRTPVGKSARVVTTSAPEPAEESVPVDELAGVADEADAAENAGPPPVLVPHQPAGKRLKIAAVAAGVLFVAAGSFTGATLQPYLADRAVVDTKLNVARTASDAIATLWTYTPDDMESLPNRSAKYLTGDFAHEYRGYIDAIVASNKQAQVTNNTQVMGAAVESLTPSEATAIVYTNSVATSPVTKNVPSLRYLSYRLTLAHRDKRWLITRMTAITQLDLTPRL